MKSTQELFFEALESRLPEGFSLNVDKAFANTGILRIFRTGTFESVVALHFSFQDGYATFSVRTAENAPLIGDRQQGTSMPAVKFYELDDRVIEPILKQLLKGDTNAR